MTLIKGFLWELGLPYIVYSEMFLIFELSKGMKTTKALSGDSKTRGWGETILPSNVLFEHTLNDTLDWIQSYLLAIVTLSCGDSAVD